MDVIIGGSNKIVETTGTKIVGVVVKIVVVVSFKITVDEVAVLVVVWIVVSFSMTDVTVEAAMLIVDVA